MRQKLVWSLLSLILAAGLLEAIARLRPHQDERRFVGGLVEPDPHSVWRLRPMASGPLRTNELGLRDTSYRPRAPVQILLLGDSVSWGDSVGDIEQIYPQRLEALLAADLGVADVEVVNSGVPGYSTHQERAWLEHRGADLPFDLLVLQFSLNDITGPYRALASFGGNNRFMGVDTRHSMRGLYGLLFTHSRGFEALARAMQSVGRRREAYQVELLTEEPLSPELESAWSNTLRELDRIRALGRDRGVPLFLLLVPYRFQLDSPESTRQPQDRLLAYCGRNRLPCLDLLPHLAEVQRRIGAPLFLDPSHLSVAGHRIVAEAMTPPLALLLGGGSSEIRR